MRLSYFGARTAPMVRQLKTTALNTGRSNLRLPKQVLRSIDIARGRRAGYVSRNSWIAEAVCEKLSKEEIDVPPAASGGDGDV